jgi:hypothetical protein
VDPITTTALAATITTLLNGAAAEAGKSAWATLSTAARRLLGGSSAEALDQVDQATDPSTVATAAVPAAELLISLAQRDAAFAEELSAWHANAVTIIRDESTTNNVSDGAQVKNLIQARDIHGPITFGS